MSITQKDWATQAARFAGLSGGAVKLTIAMETIRNRASGWITATVDTLASYVGCSAISIRRYQNELVRKGRLIIWPQWSDPGQRANRYRLVNLDAEQAAAAAHARQERRQAAYRANTVKRSNCLKTWNERLERYVWGRVTAYMGGGDSMAIMSDRPLPNPVLLPVDGEAAARAFRDVHLAVWQKRSHPRR